MRQSQAYRFITQCLSLANNRTTLAEQINNQSIDWIIVTRVASQYMVTPAFYWQCQHKELLTEMPDDFATYLQTIFNLNRQRNRQLLRDARLIMQTLNEIDVVPIFTKGTASMLSDTYPDIGMRIAADIDVLVPEERLTDCVKQMQKIHCMPLPRALSCDHHYKASYMESSKICVDLHFKVVHAAYEHLLPTQTVIEQAQQYQENGCTYAIPCPTHRVLHNIIHSQLADQHYARHTINLSQLFDLVILQKALMEAIDWDEIQQRFMHHQQGPALQAYGSASIILLGNNLPDNLRPSATDHRWVDDFISRLDHKWLMAWRRTGYFLGGRLKDLMEHPRIILNILTPAFYARLYENLKQSMTTR